MQVAEQRDLGAMVQRLAVDVHDKLRHRLVGILALGRPDGLSKRLTEAAAGTPAVPAAAAAG